MDRVTVGYEILVALIFKLQEDKFLNVSASEFKKLKIQTLNSENSGSYDDFTEWIFICGVMLSEWTYNHVSLSSNDQNPDLGVPP